MARVTVVNDNPEFLELMGEVLEGEHFETTMVEGDRPDVLDVIKQSRPEVLVLDLRLGIDELHGWDVAMEVRRDPDLAGLPILVTSADLQALENLEESLEDMHAVETLAKPFGIDEMVAAIDRLLGGSRPSPG